MAGIKNELRTVLAIERLADTNERLAVANERIVELATEEQEIANDIPSVGPAICPHCLEVDPTVAIQAARGPFAEMIVVATCDTCGSRFFGVAQGWLCFQNPEAAEAEVNGRRE